MSVKYGELCCEITKRAFALATRGHGRRRRWNPPGQGSGFADTYCDAMGILAQKAKGQGATLVGQTSSEGYGHSSSAAEEGKMFCGLALDDNNESEKTSSRIGAWVEQLKQHL